MNLEVDDGSTPVRRTSRARKVNTRFVGADIDEEYIKLVGRITASNYSDTKIEKDKKSSTEGLLAHNEYEEVISNADEVLREHHLGSKYVTVNVDKNDVNVANINCSDTSENNTNSNEDNQYINVSLKTVTLKKGKKVKGSKTIPNLTPTGEFRPSVIVQYRSSTESEASDASHGSEKKRKLPSILEEHESVKRRCDDYDVESRLAEVFNMKPVHNLDYSNDNISDFSLNREMESGASDSHVHSDTQMKSTGISAITTTKVEQNPSKIFDSTKNEMNLGLPGKTLKILSLKIPANLKSSNQSFNNQTSLSNLKSLELKLVKKDSGATVQTLPNSSPKVGSKSSIGAALTPKSHKNSKKKVSPESSNMFSSDGEDDIPLTKLMSKKALKKSKLLIKDGIKKKCMSLKKAAAKNKVNLNKVSLPEIKFKHKKVRKSDISESKLVSKDITNQDDLPLQLLRDAIAKVKKVKVTNSEESSSITETVKAPNKVKKAKSFLKHKFKSDKNLILNKEPGFKKKKTSMGVPKFEASKIHKKKPMKFKMNFPVMNKMPSNYNDLTNIVISVGESEGNYACVAVDKSKVTPNFDSPIIPLSAEPQKKYTYVEECIVPGINQGLVLESDFPDPVNLSFSKKKKKSKKFRDSLAKQDTKRTEKVDKVKRKKESLNESSNLLTNLKFQSDSKPSTGKSEAIDANSSELSPENIVKPNVGFQVLPSWNINSSDKEQKPSENSERHSVKEKVLEKHKNDTSTLVDYKEKKKRREDGLGPEESKEDKSESKSKYQIKYESKSEEKLSVDKSRKEKQKEKDIDLNKSDKNSIKKGITDNLHDKDKSSKSEGRSQKETLRNLVKSSKNLENDKQKKGIDKAIKVEEISEPKKHRSYSSERKTSSFKKSSDDEKVLIASIPASKLSGDKSVLKSSKSSRSEGKRERSLSRDEKKDKKYHRDSKDHCGSILDTKQEIEESKNLLKNKENSSKDIPVKKRDIDIKVEDQVKSNDLKKECMDEKSKILTADMKHPFELSIMFDEKEYTTKKKSRHHSRHRSKEEQSSPIKSESSSTLEIEKVQNEGKITITKLESKSESSRNTSSSSDIRSKSHHYDHKSSRHRYDSSPRSKTDRDKYRDRSKYREHKEVRNKDAAFDCKTETAETSDHNSSLKLKGDSPVCGKSSDVIEPLLSTDGVGACSSFKQEASLEPNVTIPISTLDLIKLEDPSKNQNADSGAKPQLMAKDVGLVICKPEVIVDEVYLPKLKSEIPAIKDEIKEENTDAITKDNFKRQKLESPKEKNMSLAAVEVEGNFSFKKGQDAAQISVPKLNEEIMSMEEDNKRINNSLDIKIINIKLDASVEKNVEKDKKYDGNRQLLHGFSKGNVNISKPNIGVIVRDSEERMEGKVCNESAKYLDSKMENIVSDKNKESVFENIKSLPIIQESEFGLNVMQFDSKCINSKIDESMNLINKQSSEDGSSLQSLVVVPSSLLSSHITQLTAKENDIVSFKSNIDMINKNDGIVSEEVNEKSDLKEVPSSKISLLLDDSTSTDQLKIESDKLKKTAEQIMEKKEAHQKSRYFKEGIPSGEGKQVNARIVTIDKTHESSKSTSKNIHSMSCSTEPDSAKKLLQPKLSKKPLISMEDYIHRSVFNIKSRDDNSSILKPRTEPEQYDNLLVKSDKTIENDSASVYLKKSSTSIQTEVNSGDILETIQKLGERSTPKSENKLNDVIVMDSLSKEGSCGLDVKFNSLNKDTNEVPDIISASGDNDKVLQVKPKFNENLKGSDVPKFRKQIHIKFRHSNESDSSPSVCKPWFGDEAEEVIQPNNMLPAEIIAKGDNTNLKINRPDDIKKDKIFERPKDLEVCSKLTGKDVAPGNLQSSSEIKSTNIDKVVTSRPQKKPIISMQDYLCKSVFPSSGKPDRELHQRTLKVNKKKLEKELKKKKSDEAKLLVESHSPLTQIPLGLSTIPLPGEEFKIKNKVAGLLEKTKEEDNAPFMDFLSAVPEVSSEHIKDKVELLGSFKENSSILVNLENKENLSPIDLDSRIESIPDFECQNLNASCEPEVKDFDRNSSNQDIIYEVAIEKREFSETIKKTELTPEEKQEIDKRNMKIVEERMKAYEHLAENLYLVGKVKSQSYKGDRRMICDCTLSKEEIENNETGCGEDCLNKLLMIECGSRCTLNDRCMNKNFQHKNYANVEVFNAEEKGCGVRACTDIMPGTFIMEYVGEVFDTREFKRRRKEYGKSSSAHFYFMALNQDRFIDATLKGNISRFINHSCSPNAETQKWTVNGDLRIGFFTTKTIAAGEEINFDYRLERYGREPQKCYCGTPECRGWLGESPDEKTKEEKEEDRRKELRNKKRKELRSYFGDVDLEYEIEKLNLTGLRNRQDTLNLSRLMVRALEPDTRMRLLKMLETGEEACKRLFLDYHGLKLLWSWMADISSSSSSKNIPLKLEILKTLGSLPIINKTQLTESKVMDIVERWSKDINKSESSDDKEKIEESKKVFSSASEKNELSEDSDTDTPDSKDPSPSDTTSPDDSSLDSSETPINSFSNQVILGASSQVSSDNNLDDDNSSSSSPPDADSASELSVADIALKLLPAWNNLNEAFKIPRKERLQMMKEHEREVDQEFKKYLTKNKKSDEDRTQAFYDRWRYGVDKDKDKSRKREKKSDKKKKAKRDKDDDDKNLSKEERRERFAMQVAQEDEAARQKKLQESMWALHLRRCLFLGQDPNYTPIFDPTGQFYWDPNSAAWQPYLGPVGSGTLPVPASYGGNPSLMENICLNAASMNQVFTSGAFYPLPITPVSESECAMQAQRSLPVASLDGLNIPLPEELMPQDSPSMGETLLAGEDAVSCGKGINDSTLPSSDILSVTIVLPSKWKMASDEMGNLYFYHTKTRYSQWDIPTPDLHQRLMNQYSLTSDSESDSDSDSESSSNSEDFSSDDDEAEKEVQEEVLVQTSPAGDEKMIKRVKGQRKHSEKLVQERVISPILFEDREAARKERKEAKEKAREEARMERWSSYKSSKNGSKDSVESGLTNDVGESGNDNDDDSLFDISMPFGKSSRKYKQISDFRQNVRGKSKERMVTALADNSEAARKVKESFKTGMANFIVSVLNPYRRSDCIQGRIHNTEDFKYLARKLTHFVMVKELKQLPSVEELECSESVKHKTKEFVKKYLSKYGSTFHRDPNDTKDYLAL